MGERQDGAVGYAFPKSCRLPEMIRHENRLAMSRHERMQGPEQDSRNHRTENGPHVAASDMAEATRHAAIEPVLEGNQRVHAGLAFRDATLPKIYGPRAELLRFITTVCHVE